MGVRSPGEYLVKAALRQGLILLIDTRQTIRYYPPSNMSQGLLRLINKHHHKVREWLIADAVS